MFYIGFVSVLNLRLISLINETTENMHMYAKMVLATPVTTYPVQVFLFTI